MRINIINILIIVVLVVTVFANAHGEEEFAKAEELIKQKIPCDDLTSEQLEMIGEYYMEQMHPGELHEKMDEMMGGEESDSLKQMHINMGRAFYCGDSNAMSSGMMNMMMGRGGMGGMMGGGMMNNMINGVSGNEGRYQDNTFGTGVFGWILLILFILLVVLLIVLIFKLSKRK